MDSKRWLETNLARTERLLNQVNDRLAESVAASSGNSLPRGSSLSNLIGRDRPTGEDEAAAKARQARDRGDLPQTWSSSPRGGHALGSSGLFGMANYAPAGGAPRSDWDAASRERERARERERDKERQREKSTEQDRDGERPKNTGEAHAEVVALPRKRESGTAASGTTYRADSFWPLAP